MKADEGDEGDEGDVGDEFMVGVMILWQGEVEPGVMKVMKGW